MKPILIDKILVSIEPKYYDGNPVLKLEVRSMGQVFYAVQQMTESDIESRFDIYFERAKAATLQELRKHFAEVSEPQVPG